MDQQYDPRGHNTFVKGEHEYFGGIRLLLTQPKVAPRNALQSTCMLTTCQLH